MNQILEKVHAALENYVADDDRRFIVIADDTNDIDMLTIIKEEMEEFVILATSSETQLLLNVALFDETQIAEGCQADLHQMMLELNMAMPLSSFAKTHHVYSIFGALSGDSSEQQIQEEVQVLAENIMDALEVCQHYLTVEG
jgi:uncharacterized protein YjfI (DUF2170 family)